MIIRYLRYVFLFMLGGLWVLVRDNNSILARRIRQKVYRSQCFIDTAVYILNRKNFQSGEKTSLYHGCYILNTQGQFTMGRNSHLGANCYVNVAYGSVVIGDDVAIGPGTQIIAYSNHYETGKKVTETRSTGNITIGNNVFIGAGCTILPNTVIADNVIVGAGSVVKGVLETNSIYAGSPCKQLKTGWYA